MKIEVSALSKSYDGKDVLKDFNAVFEDGSKTLLTGRSGIGKTTLLHILMDLAEPDSGNVVISDKQMSFGAVFQEDRLLEYLTAEQNIELIRPAPSGEDITSDLKRLIPDIDPAAPVSSLSGGMKRRVAVIRACLSKSDVLVMDEPFTGLDDASRAEVIRYIEDRRDGRTLIIASHTTDGMDGYRRIEIPEIE
jgi:NitT/TauT family transport system ATP-binding protein